MILKNITVIDVVNDRVLESVHILLEQDRIVDITDSISDGVASQEEVHDLGGCFAVPGLIDLHTHLIWSGGTDPVRIVEEEGLPVSLLRAADNAVQTLKSGVTCVRDLGSHDNMTIALSAAVEKGYVPGPRIISAGRSIIMTGGHDPFWAIQADGPAECIKAVRQQVQNGSKVIKISATGGVYGRLEGEDVGTAELNRDEIEVICREAHKFGLKVAAHAISEEGIWNCLEAGIDTIEHGHFLTEKAMQIMKEREIFWIPTLYVYRQIAEGKGLPEYAVKKAKNIIEVHRETFMKGLRIGVPLAAGSDAGSPGTPHGSLLNELEYMNEYGCSPQQTLKAATINAANALGLDDDIGSLEVGKKADILVVKDDPTKDISALRSVAHVFKNGQMII